MDGRTRTAIVRGVNDVASAVALSLHQAGFLVVMVDRPAPAVHRRGQAFADALFDGESELEGVVACCIDGMPGWQRRSCGFIAVTACALQELLPVLEPVLLVDARMRKRDQPEDQRGLAPRVIGLGPNFAAGRNVDVAVETAWGKDLGRVVYRGRTRPLAGEPRSIQGYGRERYVYAPCAGVIAGARQIGEPVNVGEPVAHLGLRPLRAPVTGIVRGVLRDGVRVAPGGKAVEVVPAGTNVHGVAERPAAIANGVLRAVGQG
ncbi:hypothetical protein [Alkalilimnicola ehrlichii]|uniref:hypothetical protein n=1 Tax=Alkalilimnicola ehrlichii TaxID=351052 RepID=UPI003B9F1239